MGEPDVSVIVVNWNTRELLRQCLLSVPRGMAGGQTCDVWVVDNASSDGSAAMVQAEFPDAYLIANEDNVGFARANNQALEKAQGRHLLLLNSDCEVRDGAISGMTRFLDNHAQAGAAGVRLLNGDGTVQRSAWTTFPTLASVVRSALWLNKLPGWKAQAAREERLLASATEPIEVKHLLGACLMVRREAMNAVGMMDDAYFMYLEETDWCQRLAAGGWRVWFVPGSEIIHYGQQSASLAPDKATADWCRSMCRFLRRTYKPSGAQMAAVKGAIALSVLVRFGLGRVRRRSKSQASWPGTWDVLRALRGA